MTTETRNNILGTLSALELADVNQAIMDVYLAPFATHEEYESQAKSQVEFLAVLATPEYSQHWNARAIDDWLHERPALNVLP